MESLPIPLLRLIDSYLEMLDHIALTKVCKRTNRLKLNYHDDWKNYTEKNYHFDLRFLKYLIQYKKFNDMRLLQFGNTECVKLFISSSINLNWNDGLYYACRSGNIEIVELLIQKGANHWNWGLYGACKGGNIKIVHLMISKGADHWNFGLCEACSGGNIEIVYLMMEKGADDWNLGLFGACLGGNIKIADLMMQRGATRCNWCKGTKHQF